MTTQIQAAGLTLLGRDADAVIAALVGRQHGVVARWQLKAAGIGRAAINWRLSRGSLHPLRRGVYGAGSTQLPRGLEMAAVLVCGEGARLSHHSAAVLLRLLDPPPPQRVNVTARNRRVPAWIRLHRVRSLPEDEVTTHENLPVTTPARTLLDLAGASPAADLEHAMVEALRRRLVDRAGIVAMLERYPRRRGAPLLRALLGRADDPQLTHSEAERMLRRIIRDAGMARPQMNVSVEGYRVDACWRSERVVVEVDGFALHSSHAAFQRDRRRDADLIGTGFTVIRVTWHQLTRRPMVFVTRLSAALATARERDRLLAARS